MLDRRVDTICYMDIADRIRIAREARGLNQAELARRIGVTRSAVSHWERGDSQNIKLKFLIRLLTELNVNLTWLVLGKGDMHPNVSASAERLARVFEALQPTDRDVVENTVNAFLKYSTALDTFNKHESDELEKKTSPKPMNRG